MRVLGFFLLLVGVGSAQEGELTAPRAHDGFGFPITFNDEVVTRSDVLRQLGLRGTEVPDVTLKTGRDNLLYRKLDQRVAVDLDVRVDDREVDDHLSRMIDQAGGEADFYENLAQTGQTLERKRVDIAQQLLELKLNHMYATGLSFDKRKFLPWRIRPTPRELRIAFDNDPARRQAGFNVWRLELTIDLSRKERRDLVLENNVAAEEQLLDLIAGKLKSRVDRAMAQLAKGKPFAELATECGADVDAQKAKPIEVPREESKNPADRFLQQAKKGTYSQPIPQNAGGYRVLYLIDRKDPADKNPTDPAVESEYKRKIMGLRAQKWQALMRLRALDNSTVRPARVREDIRVELLATLKDAEERLRALGLH